MLVRGLDRPNIWLGVERFDDDAHKRRALVRRVAEEDGSGIVYVATRRLTEEVADALRRRGVRAIAYHGKMPRSDREEAQEAFMSGRRQVVVATTAFGMGVDKPDVRFVFHHDVSDSLDAYYHEIGRGGPFSVGRRVRHREWGAGTVQRREPGAVIVLFDEAGYRRLAVDVVVDDRILEPAEHPRSGAGRRRRRRPR